MQKAATAAAVLMCALTANAAMYSGSLSYSPPTPPDSLDGLYVQGHWAQWPAYTVTMAWTVTDQDNSHPGFPWKYSYTFEHSGSDAGLSHVILETSSNFTSSNLTGLAGASLDSVGVQAVASGNPGMPEDMYGLRLNPATDSPTSMTWTFWSNRAPTWGDFYARCGNKQNLGVNSAFNYSQALSGGAKGFLDPDGNDSISDDLDPSGPADSGALDFHILVPDTLVVPEPLTLSTLALGAIAMLRRRR